MKRFAALYDAIDRTHLHQCESGGDARLFSRKRRPKTPHGLYIFSPVSGRSACSACACSREWAMDEARVPAWLFEECYGATGDLAESIALILPQVSAAPRDDVPLHTWVERLLSLREREPGRK